MEDKLSTQLPWHALAQLPHLISTEMPVPNAQPTYQSGTEEPVSLAPQEQTTTSTLKLAQFAPKDSPTTPTQEYAKSSND